LLSDVRGDIARVGGTERSKARQLMKEVSGLYLSCFPPFLFPLFSGAVPYFFDVRLANFPFAARANSRQGQ
jgi:hypothetical protein